MVEAAVKEMEKRLQDPPGTVHHPLVVIVDEAQVAFMNPLKGDDGRPYGGKKATSRYFMACRRLHNQGRAVSVTLWQGTQDPTDENLPKLVREGAHIRASLVVGTESQAKMALGDKAVNAGAAPHLLRQGLDKGTLVVAGDGIEIPAGEPAITVRTHFIDTDPAKEIAERARQLRDGIATVHQLEVAPDVDHLLDLAAVVGRENRVRTTEVIHRLKSRNHPVYEHWDGKRLKALLAEYGEEPGVSDGYPVVKLESVERALERRAEQLAEAQ
jgi:S-DNA-T family DNA segregation ATPase FtsK/SpoIIIE